MTPQEMDKQLTLILEDKMNSLGFTKKRIHEFCRKVNDCEQYFSFYYTRDRGLPGTYYSMLPTLSFRYLKVDELQCLFMGKEYDKREKGFGTGCKGLYTLVPGCDSGRYGYCSDNPMSDHAELLFDDFRNYAFSFYDKYDSLDKVEAYFDQNRGYNRNGFDVVRHNAYGCCIAAVLCVNGKFDKCRQLLEEECLVTDEQKARIIEYIGLKE